MKTLAILLSMILPIIPCPQEVQVDKGTCSVKGITINCEQDMDPVVKRELYLFAQQLTTVTEKSCTMTTTIGLRASVGNGKFKGFAFLTDSSIPAEGYSLKVNHGSVEVYASDKTGFLNALRTVKQLLPPEFFAGVPDSKVKWVIPCCTVKDWPRFAYRGLHLDSSRHFWSVEEVKKYLDVMAIYKMNRLHWHLTDDQGWRVEIKKYPRLTEVGAFRSGTCVGKQFNTSDGIRYGGFYTQEQIKDIVSYADALGITIIPEIDLPGHMLAALASYPELGCTGGPYDVWTRWGISPQVLCVGKEETFTFLEGVLSEIVELFPSEYIHIGGDECPKTEWQKCPECQAKIKELGLVSDDKATAEQRLQNYVTSRIQKFLADKGRKVIGWDEVLEGELAPGATVMSWRGSAGGIKAAKAGFDVIMTPNKFCYVDYYQLENKEAQPLAIGGYLPLSKMYSLDPYEQLDEEAQKHILGVQANMWTEYVATPEHLEYMILPRIMALSEIQWSDPASRDLERLTTDIKGHQFRILDALGYNYCKEIE